MFECFMMVTNYLLNDTNNFILLWFAAANHKMSDETHIFVSYVYCEPIVYS